MTITIAALIPCLYITAMKLIVVAFGGSVLPMTASTKHPFKTSMPSKLVLDFECHGSFSSTIWLILVELRPRDYTQHVFTGSEVYKFVYRVECHPMLLKVESTDWPLFVENSGMKCPQSVPTICILFFA